MDLVTALQQLSGALQQKLSHFQFTAADLLSAVRELSAIPIHPYERLKYNLFGKEYTFPSINDLKTPENFCPNSYLCQLTAISEKTNQMGLCALSSMQQNLSASLFEFPTIIEPNFLKKNLEFVEIVKSISVADIQARPVEIMQKLTSYYINNCK